MAVFPFPVMLNEFRVVNRKETGIKKLVFVRRDFHFPNYNAIEWYVNELGPTIYKKFKLKLHVIGKWHLKNIKNLSKDFIVFRGYVEDLYNATKYGINIMPIRIGSDIRTKLINTLTYSQPVITKSVGADGVDFQHEEYAFLCDSQHGFLESISFLINNVEKRLYIQNQSFYLLSSIIVKIN